MKKQMLLLLAMLLALNVFAGERTINVLRIKNLPAPWTIPARCNYLFGGEGKTGTGVSFSVTVNYDADEEMNLWCNAFSLGERNRRFDIFVNDKLAGTFGDEPLSATVKRNQLNWIKAPGKVMLKNGENTVKVVTRSGYVRLGDIYFTSDDSANPAVARVLPALSGEKFVFESDLSKVENIGAWVRTGNRLDSQKFHNGMVKDPATGKKQFDPAKVQEIEVEVEFESPVEQNVVVWLNAVSSAGKWRTTNVYINGQLAGAIGDGPLQAGIKAGGLQWEKGQFVVRAYKGKNVIVCKANSSCSRISKIIVTNDPALKP